MKLNEPKPRVNRSRAVEALKGAEPGIEFSIKQLFTPEEWQKIHDGVFRKHKDYGYIADRYFLSQVSDNPADQFQTDEQNTLFQVGDDWVKEIVENERTKEITSHNWYQALHCSAIAAKAFPDKRTQLSVAPQIKEFIYKVPGMLFSLDRLHKKATGLRILLNGVRDYLSLFPEDRSWVMNKLAERKIFEQAHPALEELASRDDWVEYAHLAAEMRLLLPDLPVQHLPKLVADLNRKKRSLRGSLYTLLPDVLNLRILAAERAELDGDGRIQIQDRVPVVTAQAPLPDRLVA